MEMTRLFDIMARQAKLSPKPDALAAKVDGKYVGISSADVLAKADALSAAFLGLGLKKGDRVALISMNRPEWALVDLAILQIGAVTVPLYPTSTAADFKYIMGHCEARLAFASTAAIHSKVLEVQGQLPQLMGVYSFDALAGVTQLAALEADGRKNPRTEELVKAKAAVQPDDLASLIYTSGTTGTPKGVMLSHRNILANVEAIISVMPTANMHRALSFLPLSHVYERTVNYFYQASGISIYYAESMETIGKNLVEVRPQVFVTVPRLLEKVYEGILAKGRELTGLKRSLFDWSVRLGAAYDADKNPSGLSLMIARRLVFSKWLAALGGELKMVLVGGSALQPRLARIFFAAGLPVLEGYGLTETSPVIAVNTPQHHRLGSVGKILPNVIVKINPEDGYRSGEGEILVQGPSIMAGYFLNPEATRESVVDGFFHTGDIGMVEDGFLKITDRKKEMFKTSGGKYVAPLVLENKFKESPFVAQVVVVGENRKFPAALVVPEAKVLEGWCKQNGVPYTTLQDLVNQSQVRDLFAAEIEKANEHFGHWERVKQFRLVSDEWSVATGEMTPKLSLKRKVIMAKYKDLIESMYAAAERRTT